MLAILTLYTGLVGLFTLAGAAEEDHTEAPKPPSPPLFLQMTGPVASDRVFYVECDLSGVGDNERWPASEGYRFAVEIRDGQKLQMGGFISGIKNTADAEESSSAFAVQVRSLAGESVELEASIWGAGVACGERQEPQVWQTSFQARENIPLGVPVQINLGKDIRTGKTLTLWAIVKEVPAKIP